MTAGERVRSVLRSGIEVLGRSLRDGWRWMGAAKAALAAGVAFAIAPHVPGVAAEYAYYAPLGAIVACGTTLAGGLRSGLRMTVGLASGIAIAFGVELVGEPNLVTIALAVGAGVWISGFRFFGDDTTWVPLAALFVLSVGVADPAGYSLGYLVQSALGAAVGLLVNLVIWPPLFMGDAQVRLAHLRGAVAEHLFELADDVHRDEPSGDAMRRRLDRLHATGGDVRAAVRRADESRRANPRVFRRRPAERLQADYDDLRRLERAVFGVTELTDLLGRSPQTTAVVGAADQTVLPAITAAMRAAAVLVRGAESEDVRSAASAAAGARLGELEAAIAARPAVLPVSGSVLTALRGVVAAVDVQRDDAWR